MSAWAIVKAWDASVPPITKLILLCIADSVVQAEDDDGHVAGEWVVTADNFEKTVTRIAAECGVEAEYVNETLGKLIIQGAFVPVGYGYRIHFDELRRNRRSVKGGL